ncbi:hypothetical protein VIGAN_04067100 [Vigna angularis var. angularis]|uniref:Uncharacterized protein n=1 Tax=Vigna angularis var. angularis TaxID=157739 RepID=A0A0S3RSH3_PHAAN|nr:hypothetical protein VIGAN_04067100 [Vigna angularis var. angularis]
MNCVATTILHPDGVVAGMPSTVVTGRDINNDRTLGPNGTATVFGFDDGPSGPTISLYTTGKVLVGCGGAELQIVSMYIEGRARLLQSKEGGPSRLLALLTRQIKHLL